MKLENTLALAFVLATVAAFATTGCKKKDKAAYDAEARTTFASTCARCHGPDGKGGAPVTGGAPQPRNFHDTAFQSTRTDEQIKLTIQQGKPPGMPAFGGAFNDEQLASLVAVVRSFDPEKQATAKR